MRHVTDDGLERRVLVTGGAGFIGYHVTRALATRRRHHVIVMDNFNDFYDITLKIDRSYELHKLGVTVYKKDLCDVTFLRRLMMSHNFTHVIHLAAQASVRYSLANPLAYVTANVECYMVLLDQLKHFTSTKLIYASSSSVYNDKPTNPNNPHPLHPDLPHPYRPSDDSNHPANMYAATKRTGEVLSDLYCLTGGLRAVGLRFFTVYGPWGRPDMVVYKFVRAVEEGKEVTMYQASSGVPLSRDFTYIDDVTSAVVAAMSFDCSQCGERFNIGYGQPISVPDLVALIERQLNKTASVKLLPLPATEKLQTWADNSDTIRRLGVKPLVQLEEGIKRFIDWFKEYHKGNSSETQSAAAIWFSTL
jgi:UDP-glucuronate 4-epimerase